MQPTLRRLPLVLLVATLYSQTAGAQDCSAPSPDCVQVGQWNISVSLGLGGRSSPVKGNGDIPLPVIPQVSYYGKRFFIENLELGFTLHEGKRTTLSVIATPGYDRAFFYRNDLQNIFVNGAGAFLASQDVERPAAREFSLPRRRTTYLVGPEWTFLYGQLIGQVNVLREATGEHDGYEVRAAAAAPIIQTESSLVVSAGLTWKSARLVRYYYGVEGLYEPGSAVNPFIKLGYSRPLSARWGINAFAHYERLAGAVVDSPIIEDRGVATVFAGLVFKVLN